jgi:hypothetical protein
VATTGATAAVSGCQPATEKILPLVVPNEHLVPGVAAWFATVCRECPAGCGVLARNREGRVEARRTPITRSIAARCADADRRPCRACTIRIAWPAQCGAKATRSVRYRGTTH